VFTSFAVAVKVTVDPTLLGVEDEDPPSEGVTVNAGDIFEMSVVMVTAPQAIGTKITNRSRRNPMDFDEVIFMKRINTGDLKT